MARAAPQGTGVSATRGDAARLSPQAFHGYEQGAIQPRATAEPAEGILPPIFNLAALQHRAGVKGASRNGADLAGQAGRVDRGKAIGLAAIAKLSSQIASPAFHPTALQQSAGMMATRRHGPRPARQAHHRDRQVAIALPPMAQLPGSVLPPAK